MTAEFQFHFIHFGTVIFAIHINAYVGLVVRGQFIGNGVGQPTDRSSTGADHLRYNQTDILSFRRLVSESQIESGITKRFEACGQCEFLAAEFIQINFLG